MLSDVDALNIHLAALAKELGFVASAQLLPGSSSGASADSTRIEVTVAHAGKTPPLKCSKSVSLADYQDFGIHTFDDFIRGEAAAKLSVR